jgi:hypothetical protein
MVCTVVLILKNIRLGVLTGAGVCAVLLLRLAELDSILNIILVFGLLATAEYYIRLK